MIRLTHIDCVRVARIAYVRVYVRVSRFFGYPYKEPVYVATRVFRGVHVVRACVCICISVCCV